MDTSLRLSANIASLDSSDSKPSLRNFLSIAVWFGVATGLVEGLGLLWFQRVNWARWGATIHVSLPILWISMLVDVAIFLFLALMFFAIARLVPRVRVLNGLVFLLGFLALYDWLSVTGRLRVVSCALLAVGVAVAFTRWMQSHERGAVQFWRRTAPWVAAIGVLTFVGIYGGQRLTEKAETEKLPAALAGAPNVVVVVVDTLRADHLSAYGYERATSPNIDRMASQGALFQNAVSAASWSLPSHASILTGRYQFEHGMGDVDGTPIRDSATPALGGYPTLGEALEKRGYRTAAFSANRSYFSENLGFGRGFIHFEDYFHSTADSFVRTLYGGELAGLYLNAVRNRTIAGVLQLAGWESLMDASFEGAGGLNGAHVRKRASTVNEEVLNWIDGDAQSHPFFVFLNYFDVHNPYGGPPNYPKPTWEQKTSIDEYDDSVKYIDDAVGTLMTGMQQRGLAQKTLVILTSDHGESLGQHGLAYHGHSLYRELVHVPLIFWYPGHVPSGARLPSPVNNAAIAVTVMDILGADARAFPGEALDGLWNSPAGLIHSNQLSELAEEHFLEAEDEGAEKRIPLGTTGAMKSIMGEQWHLIVHKKFGNQLYDWVHDPDESKNVIHTPEGEEVSRRLMAGMQDVLARSGAKQDPALSAVALKSTGTEQEETFVQLNRLSTPVNDYYRFQAEPGSVVAVNVRPEEDEAVTPMDSVVTITDAEGQPLETCRDPEDDRAQAPATPDPTPDAFDDVCINDDISPGVQTDSQLEILVPGSGHSPVELYIRVSDWNGRAGPGLKYQIAVSGPGVSSAIKAAAR